MLQDPETPVKIRWLIKAPMMLMKVSKTERIGTVPTNPGEESASVPVRLVGAQLPEDDERVLRQVFPDLLGSLDRAWAD